MFVVNIDALRNVLRQDHYLFPSEFSRECELVLLLSNSNIFSAISSLRLLPHFFVPSVFPSGTKYAAAVMLIVGGGGGGGGG